MSDGSDSQHSTSSATGRWSHPCRHFEFQEIQSATKDFDESLVIGRGEFGKVYRGTIYNGSTPVDSAIKRFDSNSYKRASEEFWAEVEMLSRFHHLHIVSLFGYCNHRKEMILVYEYMPNRTLRDHLHVHGTCLSWLQRLKICLGAARGLEYIHNGTDIEFGVIHGDIKSSNILLNESLTAKISDFGLSRITPTNKASACVDTLVKGTFGYFDPDYYWTGRLTKKSDVYAFGVVLVEVLCAKRAVDRSLYKDQWNLARWVQDAIKEGKLKRVIDNHISSEISPICLKGFVKIVEKCLVSNPLQRSAMAEVVVGLEYILTLQEKVYSLRHHPHIRIYTGVLDNLHPAQCYLKMSSNGKRNCKNKQNRIPIVKEDEFPGLIEYKFEDLKRATSNFSEDLIWREGSYGQAYLGQFENKDMSSPSMHVVKRFVEGKYEEWLTEMNVFVQLAYPTLIYLLGYCNDSEHGRFLVYEHMHNRSLDQFLHGKTDEHNLAETLSWGTRLSILTEVSRALAHLHKYDFVHGNVECSNILLDQDLNPMLADFGGERLNRETDLTTLVVGFLSHEDPAYFETGCVSKKSDVYCFGVLVLETLTGCRPRFEGHQRLVTWAIPFLEDRRNLKEIMDPHLEGNYPLEGAFECASLALSCVANEPKHRPSSEDVLETMLEIHALHK